MRKIRVGDLVKFIGDEPNTKNIILVTEVHDIERPRRIVGYLDGQLYHGGYSGHVTYYEDDLEIVSK